jgi:N-methylhydantoinase A/oxoprolinase/acetone carboxylase beta subunit
MGRLQVAIDRGGTFTDVVARTSDGKIVTMKLLSEDPEKYKDAPTEAIRRLLKQVIFFNITKIYHLIDLSDSGIFST